jgi:H+/Cl- antiporter ClcA
MAGQDPLIHIGAIVGGWVSQARTGFKKLDTALKLHVFRNERDRRDFISIGTACGMASIFNGPFGGTFFVVEEVGSFWNWETTAQMFFACVVSTSTANFWISGINYGKW